MTQLPKNGIDKPNSNSSQAGGVYFAQMPLENAQVCLFSPASQPQANQQEKLDSLNLVDNQLRQRTNSKLWRRCCENTTPFFPKTGSNTQFFLCDISLQDVDDHGILKLSLLSIYISPLGGYTMFPLYPSRLQYVL